MEKSDISKNSILNWASVAGLALGAVSTAYFFITQYLPKFIDSAVAVTAIDTVLWGLKFVGCILLMKTFMQKLVQEESGATASHTFRLGMYAAIFSALIFAAADLAYILYINPESIEEAFALVKSQYASILDSNSLAAMESVQDRIPQISFFSNFIYCALYGTALSGILCRYIPRCDPFASFRKENGEDNVEEQ